MSARKLRRTSDAPAKPAKLTVRQYCSRNTSVLTDEEAQLAGLELEKIARANGVPGVASLDKSVVLEVIEADPNHPLRSLHFWEWDVEKAARRHWLAQCDALIKSVAIVVARPGPRPRFVPLFVSASAPTAAGGSKRARIIREDALASDPLFLSHVGNQLRTIKNILNQLSEFASQGRPPREVKTLLASLQNAFREYDALLMEDAAE